MEIAWKVEDGYSGNGTQTTEVPDDELEECETEKERTDLIYQCIQHDFVNSISWCLE